MNPSLIFPLRRLFIWKKSGYSICLVTMKSTWVVMAHASSHSLQTHLQPYTRVQTWEVFSIITCILWWIQYLLTCTLRRPWCYRSWPWIINAMIIALKFWKYSLYLHISKTKQWRWFWFYTWYTVHTKNQAYSSCFFVFCWFRYQIIYPYPSGLLLWHCGNKISNPEEYG